MTADRWERVKGIFNRAVECDPASRSQLIRDYCGDDEELRREVETLLACDQTTGSLVVNCGIGHPVSSDSASTGSLPLTLGSAVGTRYTIISKLGQGGMGVVYKAHDRDLDRIVALKVLSPRIAASPSAMHRFKQEVLLASRISHKNILRTHDIGEADSTPFLTMAYVEGKDLQEYLRANGRWQPGEAVEIARQILSALEAAHAEGIVHRDLKPRNVLLDSAGQVYVSDFGLAKSLERKNEGGTITRAGEVMGTPRYMAPEQIEGKPADHRADLYAFGLILFEMLTGESPFEARTPWDSMYKRLSQRPVSPRRIEPGIPAALEQVILRCLEPDPEKRYASAREVLAALEAMRLDRSSRIRIRPRYVVITVAVLLLCAAGVLAGTRLGRERALSVLPASWRLRFERSVSIAVLPFEFTGDQAEKHLAEGAADSLSARLFPLHGVHLAAPNMVQNALKTGLSPKALAKELGVLYLLHGVFQQADDKLSIALKLDDVQSGKTIWQETFRGLRQDLLTIESEMYDRLASALHLQPGVNESAHALTALTVSFDAYDSYLKGQSLIRGGRDVKTVQRALDLYNSAITTDPSFALAYSSIADASLFMYDATRDPEWAQRARGAAIYAEQLNDALPEAHLSMASVAVITGKHAEAIAELTRAAQLAPGSDDVYRRLGAAYMAAGQYKEAIGAYRRAATINPYYWYNHNQLGNIFLQSGDNVDALEEFRRVATLRPNVNIGWGNMGGAHFRMGQWSEAIDDFKRALSIQPVPVLYANLGSAYYFKGNYPEARAANEKAVNLAPNSYFAVGNLADSLLALGQKEQSTNSYNRAIALAYNDLRVNPNNATVLAYMATYDARLGSITEADRLIGRARTIKPDDVTILYLQASVDALAGRRNETIATIQQALAKGYSERGILDTPEFRTLLGKDLDATVSAARRPK